MILNKKEKRGILQFDSLPTLLFVLRLNPLIKIEISMNDTTSPSNHLLFIDDFKLLEKDKRVLKAIMAKAKQFPK